MLSSVCGKKKRCVKDVAVRVTSMLKCVERAILRDRSESSRSYHVDTQFHYDSMQFEMLSETDVSNQKSIME